MSVTAKQPSGVSAGNIKSIDNLLDDIKQEQGAAGGPGHSSADGNVSRRKTFDRREAPIKKPRGTIERRLEDDRRAESDALRKNKQSLSELQAEQKLQQHRKKILLAGCEPVMGLNYNSLAMDDYPDNALIAEARRDRDYWVVICAIFSVLFVFSLLDVLAAWIGGVGCGLAFLSAIFAFSPARRFFFSRPHLHDLLALRKRIEYTALHHVQYLEGKDGLAWRCAKLAKYNPNLNRPLFKGVYRYSKNRSLISYLHNRKTIRLYLLLMVEAQKAYQRLEKDYLENHFKHLDEGWDDRVAEADVAKIEQSLNKGNLGG